MLTVTRRDFCGSALALAAMGCCAVRGSAKRWYKGMLHCHCYWSDGRAFPEQGIGARDYPLYSDTIGVTLKSVCGKPGERVEASYVLADDDLYVRAVVESTEPTSDYGLSAHQHPKRKMAWTQPLR